MITLSRIGIGLLGGLLVWGAPLDAGDGNPEAFEIGKDDVQELPKGKEGDGIIGDFVLRNDHIEALVSGNLPNRKANMSTYYDSPTQGCLYDLAVRGADNDQLTCFAPGDQKGPVSWVRVLDDGSSGVSRVRVMRTAKKGDGLSEQHDYSLTRDSRFLRIDSTWTNHQDKAVTLDGEPAVKGLRDVREIDGIWTGDAQNPRDRQGYAWTPVEGEFGKSDLLPGGSRTVVTLVAPGASPAEAFGVLAATQRDVGILKGRVTGVDGSPVASATIDISFDLPQEADGEEANDADKDAVKDDSEGEKEPEPKTLPAYASESGTFEVSLPPRKYRLTVRDIGRPAVKHTVAITAGAITPLEVGMAAPSRVRFVVTENGPKGRKIPCKVQFLGVGATKDPDFGVRIQAHGCDHQYFSEKGDFSLQVPPGKYRVIVTHGIEYSHHEDVAALEPGAEVTVPVVLHRVVDTRGWVSTDYHNHSTPSGDNYCGTDDRIINLAAEQIEFAPTTEHNRLYDWAPHIKKLGLEKEISTVVGIELTGSNAHFNAFPLKVTPHRQDNGAPQWVHDPRINAINLRDFGGGGPDRWVQLNHPNVGKFFRDRDANGVADGGYAGLEDLIDAAETWSVEILNLQSPIEYTDSDGKIARRENRTFAWLQLLNRGRRIWCVAVSDAHSVFGNGVGGWRTYVPSSTDEPEEIDFEEVIGHSKAGRMVVTNGPFLEAKLTDGILPGGLTRTTGKVEVDVRVQTTTWIDIDRVQILVNGRARSDVNFTRAANPDYFRSGDNRIRFEGRIAVPLTEDAHLIVVAVGESFDLETGYGRSWQSTMHPCAYTNPIFVDTDGNGFQANGDNLDHPLPVGKY